MIIDFIKKVICSIRISWLLDKSWECVSKGESQAAENYFLIIDSLTKNLSAEHTIMKAYIKYKLGKYIEAKKFYDDAWSKIDSDRDLSNDEKLYFKGYILGPAKNTLDFVNFNSKCIHCYNNIIDFSLEEINLLNVKRKWKLHFPLRDHPYWGKYKDL